MTESLKERKKEARKESKGILLRPGKIDINVRTARKENVQIKKGRPKAECDVTVD